MSSKLKVPKKQQESLVPNGTDTPPKFGAKWHHRIVNKVNKNNDDVTRPENPGERRSRIRRTRPSNEIDCKLTPTEVIAKTLDRLTERRIQKVRRGSDAHPALIKMDELNATWKHCMSLHGGFTSVIGVSAKQYAIFKQTIKNHTIDFSWQDFFTWAIDSWSSINNRHRDRAEYMRRSGKEWNMRDMDTDYLGSRTPDLANLIKRISWLIRLYVDRNNAPVAAQATNSVSMEQYEKVKAELEQYKKRSSNRASAAADARLASVRKMDEFRDRKDRELRDKIRTVKIVDHDPSFFDDEDDLPEIPMEA